MFITRCLLSKRTQKQRLSLCGREPLLFSVVRFFCYIKGDNRRGISCHHRLVLVQGTTPVRGQLVGLKVIGSSD